MMQLLRPGWRPRRQLQHRASMKLIDARTMSRLTPSQHNEMMPVLTLEQRRIFIAVAERQHITRAAEAFNLTQSAVSAAIAALESRHDAKLFNRIGRGI